MYSRVSSGRPGSVTHLGWLVALLVLAGSCRLAWIKPRLVGIPGARLKITGLDIPGLHLDLIEYIEPKGAAAAGPTSDVGNVHLGYTVDDLWAAYRSLSAAGVRFKSEPVSPTTGPNKGGWAVYFVDPDGVTLEMIQRPAPANTS